MDLDIDLNPYNCYNIHKSPGKEQNIVHTLFLEPGMKQRAHYSVLWLSSMGCLVSDTTFTNSLILCTRLPVVIIQQRLLNAVLGSKQSALVDRKTFWLHFQFFHKVIISRFRNIQFI